MKLVRKNAKGFTLVEIMIVVAIIGILIAIAVPGFVKARNESRKRSCQENLTKIDGAKEQWALENNVAAGGDCNMDVLITDTNNEGAYLKSEPKCPSGGNYTVGTVGTDPGCDIGGTHILPGSNNG